MTTIAIPHDDLVAARRRLHAAPELSMVEHETAAYVAAELGKLQLDEVRTGIGVTGVLGTLKGGKPGPVTLLRADMDALPITELNEAPYKSARPGVMHACGHDGHVSILLAAARTLPRSAGRFRGRWCSASSPVKKATPATRR
ncbi:MAG TPA: M20/M25/M40 family metallo-hydrolase [Dongiaceae bacterium]|nr:M20/M25/M40 family metallo-hydrolase [Dongiaceae bacterium]